MGWIDDALNQYGTGVTPIIQSLVGQQSAGAGAGSNIVSAGISGAAQQAVAKYQYLASIYGSDTAANIAKMNGESAQAVEKIRTGGAADVANIQAGAQKYGADTGYDIAGLNNATNRYGIDSAERLGQGKIGADIYGTDVGYDTAKLKNATDRYGQDVTRYGLDIGREVAGLNDAGATGRARIGASEGALGNILKDSRRGQMMSSPLLQSILGNNFQGLLGGATSALGGTPGSAAMSQAKPFSASNPYDSNSTVAALMSQITGQGQPGPDITRAGLFQASAGSAIPGPTAPRPAPMPMPTGPQLPPPNRAGQPPIAPPAPTATPKPGPGWQWDGAPVVPPGSPPPRPLPPSGLVAPTPQDQQMYPNVKW